MLDALLGLAILLAYSLALLVFVITAVMVYVMTHPPRRTAGNAIGRGNPTDPKEAGAPSFETVTVESDASGETEVWIAEGGDPDGPTIILLHGWADSRYGALLWYPAVGPLASRVVMYDLRGHGDSAHQRFEWGRSEVDDLRAVVRYLRSREPGAKLVAMGLSMGAMIAIDAATAGDEDADSAGRSGIDAVIADSPYAIPAEVIARMCRIMRLPSWPMTTLATWAIDLRWRGFRGFRTADRAAALPAGCPLLVMVGEADRISPVADARSVADAAPNAELHIFEGSGHLRAACTDRERYTQTLREFLARLA